MIVRIAGINLPSEKRVEIGLTAVHGIGRQLSAKILEEAGIDKNTKIKDLTEKDQTILREIIGKLAIEGDLRRKVQLDIKRLQEIGSYRGFRHKRGLPVRGQRTRKNCRTRKGRKKTVANKKTVTK
ncbi:MAG: 30S ribosomal protein S13 [Candidatus Gracilibacteria bacterium]|nr:30S ribosomal protein S13 [Candidatus Gracilibacteria bacterium]